MGKKSSKTFTEDAISRVPSKDLVRFTCVSKSWRALICSDPYLSRLQLQRSQDRPLLFVQKDSVSRYLIDLEDESNNVREIYNPFHGDSDYSYIIGGSCRGLLLQQGLEMAVSNPTTRKHVMVPPKPAAACDATFIFCGLGYDHLHDCYKLVEKAQASIELMICDLNKGTWRSLQFGRWWRLQCQNLFKETVGDECDYFYKKLDHCDVGCVHGCVYWCVDEEFLGRSRELKGLLSFVLEEEEFHVVKPPDVGEFKYYPNMTVFDQQLGLVCQGLFNRRHEFWSIQMDSLDGKRQWQWTKFLVMSDPRVMLPLYIDSSSIVLPVCLSACGNKVLILLYKKGLLFWYDIGEKKFCKLRNPVNGCFREAGTYVPSLVGIGKF